MAIDETLLNKLINNLQRIHTGGGSGSESSGEGVSDEAVIGLLQQFNDGLDAMPNPTPKYSNPNLIINPDFKINQRNQQSYTGAIYGVDRWHGIYGSEKVTPTADGIILEVGGNQSICTQLEQSVKAGTALTVSINCEKISGNYQNIYVEGVKENGENELFIARAIYAEETLVSATNTAANDYKNLRVHISGDGMFAIHWIKLEFGSVATPFVHPDPATELLKCQRYYFKIQRIGNHDGNHASYSSRIHTNTISRNSIGISIAFPCVMRIRPNVNVVGNPWSFRLFNDSTRNAFTPTDTELTFDTETSGFTITMTNDYFSTARDGFIASLNHPNQYTEFDAEIY